MRHKKVLLASQVRLGCHAELHTFFSQGSHSCCLFGKYISPKGSLQVFPGFFQLPGAFPSAAVVKKMPASAGNRRDEGSVPGSGWSPGGGRGNQFQYSCLENSMDRGAPKTTSPWGCKELGLTEQLSAWLCVFTHAHTHTRTHINTHTHTHTHTRHQERKLFSSNCCSITQSPVSLPVEWWISVLKYWRVNFPKNTKER